MVIAAVILDTVHARLLAATVRHQIHALPMVAVTVRLHTDIHHVQQLVVMDKVLKHAQQTGVAIVVVIQVIIPDVVVIVIDRVVGHVLQIDVETVLASVDIEKDVVDIVIHSLLIHAQQTDVKIVHVTLDIEQVAVEIVIHSIMIRALKMDAVIVVVRQVLVMAVLEIVILRKIKLVVQMVVDNAHLIKLHVGLILVILMYYSVW